MAHSSFEFIFSLIIALFPPGDSFAATEIETITKIIFRRHAHIPSLFKKFVAKLFPPRKPYHQT